MFVWPTSLLPICPSGRPTSSPEAESVVLGQVANSASRFGVFATDTAFHGPGAASP